MFKSAYIAEIVVAGPRSMSVMKYMYFRERDAYLVE